MAQVWSIMGWVAVMQAFLPPQLRRFIELQVERLWGRLCRRFFAGHVYVEVQEDLKGSFKGNLLYRDVEAYLSSLDCMQRAENVRVQRKTDTGGVVYTLPPNETVEDCFLGTTVSWTHRTAQQQGGGETLYDIYGRKDSSQRESRSFSLKLPSASRERVLPRYLAHVTAIAKEIERSKTQRKLYTNNGDDWEEVEFKHPSNFDTLALLPELKERVKEDLLAFKKGESFYHSVGRAWKRGYLLYGPPGTGKSSMIAAMANYISYDIYDLELTSVSDNAELKSLLIRTTRKAIIVIEDIDCSLDLSERATKDAAALAPTPKQGKADDDKAGSNNKPPSKVTLSGLLNLTDGLWSCCGEERIFVFTTNHKDKLDPALLRCGRMDLHILLSYCTFPAFKLLCANYLGLDQHADHELFPAVQSLIATCNVTPAEVVELLLSSKTSDTPSKALERVCFSLQQKSCSSSSSSSTSSSLATSPPSSFNARSPFPAPLLAPNSKPYRRILKSVLAKLKPSPKPTSLKSSPTSPSSASLSS